MNPYKQIEHLRNSHIDLYCAYWEYRNRGAISKNLEWKDANAYGCKKFGIAQLNEHNYNTYDIIDEKKFLAAILKY